MGAISKDNTERERLEKYATALHQKVFTTQSDLGMHDRVMVEMLDWSRQQSDIVVLSSGDILTSQPASRMVQNCKTVMMHKGLRPGRIVPAVSSLIAMLVNNAEEEIQRDKRAEETVTVQQQRLRMLVREAISAGASDIHIEVREEIARIRFRKHGELYVHAEWLPKMGREVAAVAFNRETDNAVSHFNPLVPQNASMPLPMEGLDVRLRLASMPAHGGYDVVMRVLTAGEERIPDLDELGYTPDQIVLIRKAVKMPHGAIVMSGPTGSGKTTTLASCMRMVSRDRKIYTIEDPVEKIVVEATQVPVNSDQFDRTFASMGRATLRMDPDVVVLGEVRDEDTAHVMVRAAITGHLVFSTLHTNTAPAIVTRLVDMGISSRLLADPNLLVLLICQRLVPKLCPHCAVPVTESAKHAVYIEGWRVWFGDDFRRIKARAGKDCAYCKGLSIIGRLVVAEVVWVDNVGRTYIQNVDIVGWEKYLREQGWQSYADHALNLVRQGLVDPFDAEKVAGEITMNFSAQNFDYRTLRSVHE